LTLTPEILKKARFEKGLTQEEVAKAIGISQTVYGYYEKGIRIPKVDKVEKLVELLEIKTTKDIIDNREITKRITSDEIILAIQAIAIVDRRWLEKVVAKVFEMPPLQARELLENETTLELERLSRLQS
jgi:transcriptional regulator with XRE-family HTH domain